MKNNGVIAAAQVIWQSLALLIVYRIAAQTAGVGTLGAWSTAVAIAGLITVADIGLTEIVVREVAHANGLADWPRVKGLCRSVLRFVPLAMGLAAISAVPVIAYLLHALTPSFSETTAVTLAAGALASVWLTVLGAGAAGVLEAFGRYDLKAIAAFASGAISIPTAYIAADLAPDLTIVIALVTGGAVNLLLLLGAGYYLLRRLPGKPRAPTAAERTSMLRLGFNARFGSLANLGFDPVVRFLLLRFGGAEAAGLYEIAYRLVIQLRSVLVASTQVIVPRLTSERARGAAGGMAAIAKLTASLLRLAGPALWGILVVLPLLSAAMIESVDVELMNYGLALTLAWLVNAVAVPAYYGNFVDGALRVNRTSHAIMLIAAAVLGAPAGVYFGALGVVIATSLAIALGSAFILASRRRDLAAMAIAVTRSDYAVNLIGLVGATSVFLAAVAALPVEQQVYAALAAAVVYFATATRFVARLVREHLRQVAG